MCLLSLKEIDPATYIAQLSSLSRTKELFEYIKSQPGITKENIWTDECQDLVLANLEALKISGEHETYCKETADFYTIYIIEYFNPWLEELRSQEKLK